jgi:GTP-binding protein EngB required for normal cell division
MFDTRAHLISNSADESRVQSLPTLINAFIEHKPNYDRVFRLLNMQQSYLEDDTIANSLFKTRVVRSLTFTKHDLVNDNFI